jgi:hypothetical protein
VPEARHTDGFYRRRAAGSSAGLAQGCRWVDGRAGRDDPVDAVQHRLVEGDVGRGELAVELLHGPRPKQRRGDGGMLEHERDRELDERDPRFVGELGELLDGIQLPLVGRLREIEALGQPAGARRGLLPGVLAPAARQPAAGQRTAAAR